MAPTSDERREVAERLRGLDVEITSHDTLEQAVDKLIKAVCGDIPFSPIRYSVRNLCGLANMLADLIDPTCHVDVNEHGRAYCTNCGCDDWCLAEGSPYCPNCGARVVGDDE